MRHYVAPDGSGFVTLPDDDRWGAPPEGWEQVSEQEYERRLAEQRTNARQRADEFLQQARSPLVDAGRALVDLGLAAEHAAVVVGVPLAELEPARG